MGQPRPADIEDKDVGASEFPHNVPIQPYATEENTGTSYNSTMIVSSPTVVRSVNDLLSVVQNPILNHLTVTVYSDRNADLTVGLYTVEGRKVRSVARRENFTGELNLTHDLTGLPAGLYVLRGTSRDRQAGVERVQTVKVLKSR